MENKNLQNLKLLSSHLAATSGIPPAKISEAKVDIYPEIIDYCPEKPLRIDINHLQGWGYKDTQFSYEAKTNRAKVTGFRYPYSEKWMPNLKAFTDEVTGMDPDVRMTLNSNPQVAAPNINHEFFKEIGERGFSRRSFEKWERYMHSHGESLEETFTLRYGTIKRVVDVVLYPDSSEQVERIVQAANKHGVVLSPQGGASNVTDALVPDEKETRMIVSVDMGRMNKMLYLDKENMLACFQAGINGKELEEELQKHGFTLGHEPDSLEFSTLGGWIATRASGMKKNLYGNIEDLVQNMKVVTCVGTYTKKQEWPRISAGPDLNHVFLGSEGNLGIVTEGVIKIRFVPEISRHGTILFPDFESGMKFMQELAVTKQWPASCRLIDNLQFRFGQALKLENESIVEDITDVISKFYVLNIKGLKGDKMCAATVIHEGRRTNVELQEENTYRVASKYGGFAAGEESSKRAYFMTFMIAYMRDFTMDHYFSADSMETSCPWSEVSNLINKTKELIFTHALSHGLKREYIFATFRVTQLYETGGVVYIYYGFNFYGRTTEEAVSIFEGMYHALRTNVISLGGSISHHHGVGKKRRRYMNLVYPEFMMKYLDHTKKFFDPNNVFGQNNTFYLTEEEKLADADPHKHKLDVHHK